MDPERVTVFVDGNNLYHRLKERGWPTWVSIGSLAKRLVGGDRCLNRTYYYNAPPPSNTLHEDVGKTYLDMMTGAPDIIFQPSRLQRTKKIDATGQAYDTFTEKGADVNIVADMVGDAALNSYDTAILVSNDGDFASAVPRLRRFDKRLEIVYFKGSKPFAMDQADVTMREFRQGMLRELDRPGHTPPRNAKRKKWDSSIWC